MLSKRLRISAVISLIFAAVGLAAGQSASITNDTASLSEQIAAANYSGAPTTITLAADITLSEALPPITGDITIDGAGYSISGDNQFRILDVNGGQLTINNLTLTLGSAQEIMGPVDYGGALRMRNRARVTVNDAVFNKNVGGWGGAIGLEQQGGRLIVNRSRFRNNRSLTSGGAIRVENATVEIYSSSFNGNSAYGIFSRGGAVAVGNTGELYVANSIFTRNYAKSGGAVGTEVWGGDSGAMPKTTLTHVTLFNNHSLEEGNAIYIDHSDRNFSVYNSIIAGGLVGQCAGPLNDNFGNLIQDGSCVPSVTGDPLLLQVAEDDAYLALRDGSPALDAADPSYCLDTDQVGTPRPHGDGCDIGAFESTTAIVSPTPAAVICTLRDQILASNSDSPVGACPAGRGADTITMVRDYTFNEPPPRITSELSIDGQGFTISGDRKFVIFDIDGGSLSLSNVTLTEGRGDFGAAMRLRNGAVAKVTNVTFTNNWATYGGALATSSYSDRLTVAGSTFVGNKADKDGGAILADGGSLTISESAFLENYTRQNGGAIAAADGRIDLSNSTFHDNQAELGGGIYIEGARVTLTHLTMVNNKARRIRGAGVYGASGLLYLRNSIIARNGSGDDCYGRLDQSRGNFSEDGSCATRAGGDPLLEALVESPPHFPLTHDSRAHGQADRAFCLESDQLGNPRPHCDIGAIESLRPENYTPEPPPELPAGCSLHDQIIAANTDAPAGNCPAGDGADIIKLRRSVTLSGPLPIITSDLTIDGNGHTIDGDHKFLILEVEDGNSAIKNIKLVNGHNPEGYGGAIFVRGTADLTASNVTFRDNLAQYGGAIATLENGVIRVFHSSFFDNEATDRGGSAWMGGQCTTIDKSIFRRSKARVLPHINDVSREHEDGPHGGCLGMWSNQYYST